MSSIRFGSVLRAALLAGLAAGLTVAIFHLVATEPIIEQAIALEHQQGDAATAHDDEPPLVSRETQYKGLVVGYVLFGLTWALLFGIAYQALQGWLPGVSRARHGITLALVAYWTLALLPFLKYPANPPGVGDPETIGWRQAVYVSFLALSVLGTLVSFALGRALAKRAGAPERGWLFTAIGMATVAVALLVLMPSTHEDTTMPAALITGFRTLSIVGLTVYWLVLGVLFGKLIGSNRAVPA